MSTVKVFFAPLEILFYKRFDICFLILRKFNFCREWKLAKVFSGTGGRLIGVRGH